MAEEVVAHGDDPAAQAGKARLRLLEQTAQERRRSDARRDGEVAGVFRQLLGVERGEKIVAQRAEHPHAVFNLAVALVVVRFRQRQPRAQEQLVRAEEAACAEAAEVLLPELLGDGDDLPRAVGVDGAELRESLAVLRDADGDERAARELPVRQVAQRPAELVAVVPAGADDDLAVHDDARLAERADILERAPGVFVAEHRAVQLRIRRVDGDVDGADVQVDDALRLALGEVREGDIVAEQEGKARVVVLEIERLTHAGGHLVDEAEDAVVRARAHLVHEIGVEVQAEILPLLLPDMDGALRPVRFAQRQVAVCIIPVKAVVQNIYDLMSVDGQQLLAGLDSRELRRAAPVNGCDNGTHCINPRI